MELLMHYFSMKQKKWASFVKIANILILKKIYAGEIKH